MDNEQRELAYFFGVAYLFSWLLTVPMALSDNGILGLFFPYYLIIIARFGPTITAILMITRKKDSSIIDFLLDNLKIHVKPIYYLFALLLPGVIGFLSVYLGFLIRGLAPNFMWTAELANFPLLFVVVFFIGGPLGEEYGWRGYAFPRLLKRYSLWESNLILGLLWGFWHLPLFWITGTPQSEMPILSYMIQITAYSFIYTWMYRKTGGSIFILMVFHAAWNTFVYLIPYIPPGQTSGTSLAYNILLVLLWVVAILVQNDK